MHFPEHVNLQLEHNPHKVMGMTVESFFDSGVFATADWISKEERGAAIESQDVWELTWFNGGRERFLLGHDLDKLLKVASTYDSRGSRSIPS